MVSGTCIGAGMLALPIVTSHCGFGWSVVLFLGCWLVMLLSSLLVLEVNSALPDDASFSSMAAATLGPWGKSVTWLMFLLLLFSLLAAYDTAGAALISALFKQMHYPVSLTFSAVLFTVILGSIVVIGTRLTDYANRALLILKLALFFIAAMMLLPSVNLRLLQSPWGNYRYLLSPLPVVLTAFGSHFIIPTIRRYIGPEPVRLRRIIIAGMLIPLGVYLLWQWVTLGVVPVEGPHGLRVISRAPSSVESLVLVLVHSAPAALVKVAINGFMDIAVTTSFLGISLSLFDFFMDGFTLSRSLWLHRLLVAGCTFIAPLLFAVFLPGGFVMALQYAAVFAAVLVLIMPALMSLKIQASGFFRPFYRQSGGAPLRVGIFMCGCFVIMLFILISAHRLPV